MAEEKRRDTGPKGPVGGGEAYVGVSQAARLLGVSAPTVRRWVGEGRVPARKVGRKWQIRRADLGTAVAPAPPKGRAVDPAELDPAPVVDKLRTALRESGLRAEQIAVLVAETLAEVRRALPDSSEALCEMLVLVFLLAVRSRASDVHADHTAGEARVRLRIDGVLSEVVRMPSELLAALIAELKPWMRLDPKDTQRSQDGRVTVPLLGREIDLRVSTLPTMHGEALAVRIIDRAAALRPLEELGFEPVQLARYRERLHSNTGLIIVTGPAGCGRTTTVYASLNELANDRVKVMTAEDPVEYELDGIVQSRVRPELGMGYERTVASIMRQDPDIVFVGDTRDAEVGDMVCRAGMTGHIVLTTMYTNDAPSAPVRLVEMGVDPRLVATSLLCVTCQRLVRAVCDECAERYAPSPEGLELLGLEAGDHTSEFRRGKGCSRCNGTGYHGRIVLFQMLDVTGPVRAAIMEGVTEGVREAGRGGGLCRSFAEIGGTKAMRGETTVEEVARVLRS